MDNVIKSEMASEIKQGKLENLMFYFSVLFKDQWLTLLEREMLTSKG